jgi:hypothetical protein
VTSYCNWEDVLRELLTEGEIAESEQRAQLLLAQVYAYRLAEIRECRGLARTDVGRLASLPLRQYGPARFRIAGRRRGGFRYHADLPVTMTEKSA